MEIKIKDIERYQSSDSPLFRNLPVGSYGSIFNDESGHRPIRPEAYIHGGGGVINFKGQTRGTAKFIYFNQKERTWSKKKFWKCYCHLEDKKHVYISERRTEFDMQLKPNWDNRSRIYFCFNEKFSTTSSTDNKKAFEPSVLSIASKMWWNWRMW